MKRPVLFWTLFRFLIFQNILLSFIPVKQRFRIVKSVTHITLGKFLHNPLHAPDLIALPRMTLPSMCVSVWESVGVCHHASGCSCLSNLSVDYWLEITFWSKTHFLKLIRKAVIDVLMISLGHTDGNLWNQEYSLCFLFKQAYKW